MSHVLVPAAVIALPAFAVWLWRAIFRPMAPCRRCGGQSRVGDRERWRNRDCSRCDNKRERMTLGARLVRGQGRGWGK
jgi:hypothetical protein